MGYMARNIEKRLDPGKLMQGARSVIVLLMNYYPEETLPEKNNYKIAKYAYGKDYHLVIRDRLNQLTAELKTIAGEFQSRAFTDSAPVLERSWAEKAGLGWIGKNTCLINPKIGSFVFIGEIITDLELDYDKQQINDLCGGCTRCIDACPTGAILAPRLLDARKCISYHTIESKGELPQEDKDKFQDWIFGCDICQDVCPWNRKASSHKIEEFKPHPGLFLMDKSKWDELTEEQFKELFKNSAVKRTKYAGLKRNIYFHAKKAT
jgi:epoxyqueuosine reductase